MANRAGSSRPRLLDLFCGAGGAAAGYALAGFEVVGVDIELQPRYPFAFVQADALEALETLVDLLEIDVVHASPPCQAYSTLRGLPWIRDRTYWDSIPPTLEALGRLRIPWILENVERAPVDGITLCGTMFGLGWDDGAPIYRHRRFASSEFLLAPGHPTHRAVLVPGKATLSKRGHMGRRGAAAHGSSPMAVDWMTQAEAGQAIPPAYTRWVGEQLLARLA